MANNKNTKIIDALPANLKKPLMRPRLRSLTFSDLETIQNQLGKLWIRDKTRFHTEMPSSCSGCWPWN